MLNLIVGLILIFHFMLIFIILLIFILDLYRMLYVIVMLNLLFMRCSTKVLMMIMVDCMMRSIVKLVRRVA